MAVFGEHLNNARALRGPDRSATMTKVCPSVNPREGGAEGGKIIIKPHLHVIGG